MQKQITVNAHRCTQCGTTFGVVGTRQIKRCPYCGNQSFEECGERELIYDSFVLQSEPGKKKIEQLYSDAVKQNYYVPDEYEKIPSEVNLQVVYLPVWEANSNIKNENISMKGVSSYTTTEMEGKGQKRHSQKYTIINYYKLKADIDGTVKHKWYNASTGFRDYYLTKEFGKYGNAQSNPASVGVFAKELSDERGAIVDLTEKPFEIFEDEAQKAAMKASDEILKKKGTGKCGGSVTIKRSHPDRIETVFEKVYVPVRMYTTGGDNQLAYVVNDYSGKMHADTPVDYNKMLKPIFIVAGILFLLLSLIKQLYFTPIGTAIVSSYLLCMSSLMLVTESKKVATRNIFSVNGMTDATSHRAEIKWWSRFNRASGWDIVLVTTILMIMLFVVPFMAASVTTIPTLRTFCIFMLILQVIPGFRIIFDSKKLGNSSSKYVFLLGLIAQIVAIFIATPARPDSFWHYAISIDCLTVSSLMFAVSVLYTKKLTANNYAVFAVKGGANEN